MDDTIAKNPVQSPAPTQNQTQPTTPPVDPMDTVQVPDLPTAPVNPVQPTPMDAPQQNPMQGLQQDSGQAMQQMAQEPQPQVNGPLAQTPASPAPDLVAAADFSTQQPQQQADTSLSTDGDPSPVTMEDLMEELQHIEDKLDEMDEKL